MTTIWLHSFLQKHSYTGPLLLQCNTSASNYCEQSK
jgi:hypothetical protein